MKVLILGFETKEEVNAAMEGLIAGSGCYLFTAVLGDKSGASYEWCVEYGCPHEIISVDRPDKLLNRADYLVVKINENTPMWIKNLMMAWKMEGKHGSVFR